MKKIAVVTGCRSDYGLLRPIIELIAKDKELQLQLFVTGAHLKKKFDLSFKEIEKDGFKITEKIFANVKGDSNYSMSLELAKTIKGFSKAFKKNKPEIVLVLGDRVEIFGAVSVAFYMNISIAHIHGGDKSAGGHLDDSIRHSITKLSHLHFAASEKSAMRIKKLGEESWRVNFVGAPGIDSLRKLKLDSEKKIRLKYDLSAKEDYLLVVQHAITTEVNMAGKQIEETLEALKDLKIESVIVYPNADAGGKKIIEIINKYNQPFIKKHRNIEHTDYISLLKYCSAMVGNSSGALIEAPTFKIPVVNIGNRQKGREKTINVIDCENKKLAIKKSILLAISNDFKRKILRCVNPYGDGHSAEKIVKVLKEIELDKKLLQKQITY